MSFLNNLKEAQNYTLTQNGALAKKTTGSKLYDLFALGAAYRSRNDADKILLFKEAFEENEEYAMKCLFYIRDVRGGQGERAFFRTCYKWLLKEHYNAALRNLDKISEYGRWDDLIDICQSNEKAWKVMIRLIQEQIKEDLESIKAGPKTPVSLLAKWMPSENTSSAKTRKLAKRLFTDLGMQPREYRKMLSMFRDRINIVERLMSANKWDEIQFDKLPSQAGMKYRKCYARRDETKERYAEFMSSRNTKVNASTMVPAEVVKAARNYADSYASQAERDAINKYWDNLTDYFKGKTLDALAVVDTSGSMTWGAASVAPIDVAISLGMYCAEKAPGPFANHYITFSREARLVEIRGVDFVDKVHRIVRANLCENTNIANVFRLILKTAVDDNVPQEELPKNIIIISDMQFDMYRSNTQLQMESFRRDFAQHGYKLPHIIYWNVNAMNDTISDNNEDSTFVSGYSPVLFEQILSGKTGYDLMMDKLNSERYSSIH